MDEGYDELARARRRFEAERAAGQSELERAQAEFDDARRGLNDVLVEWAARGSTALLALTDGRRFVGVVVAEGPDHVVLDDDDRGEVLLRLASIRSATEIRGVAPRRTTRRTATILGELRTAVAMERAVTLWEADGPVVLQPTAIATDHLLARSGAAESLWALGSLDALSIETTAFG